MSASASVRAQRFATGEISRLSLMDILTNSDRKLEDMKEGMRNLSQYVIDNDCDLETIMEAADISKFSAKDYGTTKLEGNVYLGIMAFGTVLKTRRTQELPGITRSAANALDDSSRFGTFLLEYLVSKKALNKEKKQFIITTRYVPDVKLKEFEANKNRLFNKIHDVFVYWPNRLFNSFYNVSVREIAKAVKNVGRQRINHLGIGNIVQGLKYRTNWLYDNKILFSQPVTVSEDQTIKLTHHLDSKYALPYNSVPLFHPAYNPPSSIVCTQCQEQDQGDKVRRELFTPTAEKRHDIFTLDEDRVSVQVHPFVDEEKQEPEMVEFARIKPLKRALSPVYRCPDCDTTYYNAVGDVIQV